MEYIYRYRSPLGDMTMAGDGTHLTGLWFDGQKYDRRTLSGEYEEKALPVFRETGDWLDTYFSGKEPETLPEILLRGTDFQRDVWRILLTIPYGQTMTYGEIAARLSRQRGGSGMSAQAVGGAVGHNPVSILIPCHRVIGADGSLTGYAGGIGKKRFLLELEHAELRRE